MFRSAEPGNFLYPIRGLPPALGPQNEQHYLHAAAIWDGNVKSGIGVLTCDRLLDPRIPVHRYVRIPTMANGVPDRGIVEVHPPVEMTEHDLRLLQGATNALGISWDYQQNADGIGVANVQPTQVAIKYEHTEAEVFTYSVHSSAFVLAGLRALAMDGVLKHIAAQN